MTTHTVFPPVHIGPVAKAHSPPGLGCWSFAAHGFAVSQQGLFTGLPRGMYTYLTTEDAPGTTVELLENFDEE